MSARSGTYAATHAAGTLTWFAPSGRPLDSAPDEFLVNREIPGAAQGRLAGAGSLGLVELPDAMAQGEVQDAAVAHAMAIHERLHHFFELAPHRFAAPAGMQQDVDLAV